MGVRTVFKSDTTLRSHLVRPKDALEPTKQDGVVYKIPCECGKVYIGETGRAMQDRIKEHNRDIRLARTQTSAVSEHANETGHLPIWKEVKSGAIIGDGDRKRGFHAVSSKKTNVTNVLFLEKNAPPSTS